MIEARAASKSMTPKNLAQLEGVAGPDELRARYLRVEVFSNDDEALDALHEASNGFEHGYMAFDDARERLEPVLERSMGYVRRALVEASGAPPEVAKALLADDYAEPRGLVPPIPMMFGQLSRKETVAPSPSLDADSVELEWNSPDPVATRDAAGEVNFSFPWEVTVRSSPGVDMKINRFALRAAHLTPVDAPPGP